MGSFIATYLILLICGGLVGLIPYGIGRYLGKPRMGQMGLILCAVGALLHTAIPLPVAIAFVIAEFVSRRDLGNPGYRPVVSRGSGYPASPSTVQLICTAGPLKGQSYTVGSAGLTIGRDPGCAVRLPANSPGISRTHCCVRYQEGMLVLVDLNSAFGTFQGDGTKLPPNYPMQLTAGSRFYLANPNVLFEIRYR